MESTLHDLGEILLKAVPTFFLVILLHFYLKFMFFKPMEKVLHQRYMATEGARKLAKESLELAAAKVAEYEAALRAANNELYLAQERVNKELQQKETEAVAAARQNAEAAVEKAKAQLAQDTVLAKASLEEQSEKLAGEIADTLLRRSAA
jgi:F-type H+-transporting ATPase subunit b